MTLEDLKKYREKVKSMTETMQKDCQYIEEDIQRSKDTILLDEENFCKKMYEYETLMPTWYDLKKIKNISCISSYFQNTDMPYYAPVIRDGNTFVRVYDFTEYGARIVINIFHHSSNGSRYKQFSSQVVLNNEKTGMILKYDNWHDEERESAKVAILKNQDKLFEMMGQLVLKVNEKYAEMLRQYNEDLLADAKGFIK